MLLLIDDAELFEAASESERVGVAVALVVGFDGEGISMRDASGVASRLTNTAGTCIGLASSGKSADWIDPLRAWWRRGGDELPFVLVPRDASAETRRRLLLDCMARGLARSLEAVSSEYRSAVRQNRILRRSYEALQTAFDQVEQFIVANRLQTPILHFEAPPDACWTPDGAGAVVRQTLPILSPRLSFLELFFRNPGPAGEGALTVRLLLEPSNRVLAEWALGPKDMVEGWNIFRPPPVLNAPDEVVVDVAWPQTACAAQIGLARRRSRVGAIENRGSQPDLPGSLAMRLWSGLPGVRAQEIRSAPATVDERLTPLPPIELLRASEYEFGQRRKARGQRAVRETEGRLLVHPFGAPPTIAVLPNPLPAGVTHVSVEGRTIDDRASSIAYAIAVVPPDVAPEEAFLKGAPRAAGFSGWRVLEPWQSRRIRLTLDQPTTGAERLYLATRLPVGSHGAWAWSTWRDVMIGFGRVTGATDHAISKSRGIMTEANEGEPVVFWKGGWRTPLDLVATHAPAARSALRAIGGAASLIGALSGRKWERDPRPPSRRLRRRPR